MLDLLIVQHEDDTPPGTVLQWAQNNGIKYQIWNVSDSSPAPFAAKDVDNIVICGGSMDTWEEEKHPWLKTEKKFIQECLALKKPLFGLCLGSQLLAEALGAKSRSMEKWEIGFQPVTLLGTGKVLKVFHWHQFTFDLPVGAELLATNDFCVNQAFSYGDFIVATQFHPEATEEWILECADQVGDRDYKGHVQTKEEMKADLALQKTQQEWFFSTLDLWFKKS